MAPAGSDTALAAGAPWNAGDPAGGAGQCGRRGRGTGESLRQGHKHLHVAEREEARLAVQHALVPVLIDLVGQRDDVTLTEAQLPVVLGLEVVQRLAARLVQGRWGREQAVGLGLLRLTPPSLGSQTCCDLERVGGHGPPLCPATSGVRPLLPPRREDGRSLVSGHQSYSWEVLGTPSAAAVTRNDQMPSSPCSHHIA